MSTQYLNPSEIVDYTIKSGVTKINKTNFKVFLSAIMAGIFIAIGAASSNAASFSIANASLAKVITGAVFPVGLMLIVIIGADLFTSNCLLSMAVLDKKITLTSMIKNLILVYLGNFVGAFTIALIEITTGQFEAGNGALGGLHISIASHKLDSSFVQALLLGILCNIVVCGAALMMYAGKDIASKLLGCFFPIFAFIIAGFQHSIANMYYFPAALLAKSNINFVNASNVSAEHLEHLTWKNFFIHNLIPVTIGNIIGGSIIMGCVFWYLNKKK